jgi:hypothetical protein
MAGMIRVFLRAPALALAAALVACATREPVVEPPPLTPVQARSLIAGLLPANTADRAGWAADIQAAFAALRIAPTPANACAVIAVTEQESGWRADPAVPGLGAIAWREIEQRAQAAGVPMLVVRAALQITSPDGKTYARRIDAVRTERELSDIFEDFIGMVPMGKRLFAGWNPVRTGGPMQVSIAFAESHASDQPYPYPMDDSIRHEVFTRRGGLYFGIAHLLDYPATYDKPLYRFADYNAGRWASRNAALQNAISTATGIPLALDGDLVSRTPDRAGPTEAAARALGDRLHLSDTAIRRDLEQGDGEGLERTALYRRVFELAEKTAGQALPRAMVPRIDLHGPKITRRLTTAWFADRVDQRYRRCMGRAGA